MAHRTSALSLLVIFVSVASGANETTNGNVTTSGRKFTIVNNCNEKVWPGITNSENFNGSVFTLNPGQSAIYTASSAWNGRIWGRTGCKFDTNGNGTCQTGDCGSIKCAGPGNPPATIADFTLSGLDFYDVSLVDGFNLPIAIEALHGKGNCSKAGCDGDLRKNCSSELELKANDKVIACKSACQVFNTDEYCCRGDYGNPVACHPSNYSRSFKEACPAAYSYAYDDPTSILTCSGAEYVLTFCGSRNHSACTYHDIELTCSGTSGLKWPSKTWWFLILALPFTLILKSDHVLTTFL